MKNGVKSALPSLEQDVRHSVVLSVWAEPLHATSEQFNIVRGIQL